MPDPWFCKARAIGSRLDCLNLRLQGWNVTSTVTRLNIGSFQFAHNTRRRGKALLAALVAALVE